MPSPSKTYKVVVLGSKCVGKTAILEHLIYGNHSVGSPLPPTTEDIYVANILTDRGTVEKVRFYDTAGLDPHKLSTQKHYYTYGAEAYILVYDITSWESFSCLHLLKDEIERLARDKKDMTFLVLGSRSDLEHERRQVDSDTALKWAAKERVKLHEVTVTNRQSLTDAFVWLVSKISQPQVKNNLIMRKLKGVSLGGGSTSSEV